MPLSTADRARHHFLAGAAHTEQPLVPGQLGGSVGAACKCEPPARDDRVQQAPARCARAGRDLPYLAQLHQEAGGERATEVSGDGRRVARPVADLEAGATPAALSGTREPAAGVVGLLLAPGQDGRDG